MARTRIIEILRPYGGEEGSRVKRGTRFAIGPRKGETIDGMRTMTEGRFKQLSGTNPPLAREFDPRNSPVVAQREEFPEGKRDPLDRSTATAAQIRADTRRRAAAPTPPAPAKKQAAPAAPRQVSGPAGGQTGAAKPAQSSPVAPASAASTSGQRGTRRSGGSPAITPSDSSPGPGSNTDRTATGGASTTPPSSRSRA